MGELARNGLTPQRRYAGEFVAGTNRVVQLNGACSVCGQDSNRGNGKDLEPGECFAKTRVAAGFTRQPARADLSRLLALILDIGYGGCSLVEEAS